MFGIALLTTLLLARAWVARRVRKWVAEMAEATAGMMVGQMAARTEGWQVVRSGKCLVECLIECLVECLVDCLVECLVERLVECLVDC